MKKLNRKGFTLIELLAVIVVLAIVLVVTIPSVLSSMSKAREEQFKNAVATVEEYMKKQIDACNLANTDLADYETGIFVTSGTDKCKIDTTKVSTIVGNAGYKYGNDDSEFKNMVVTSEGEVSSAAAGSDSKFSGATYSAS